MSVLSKFTVIDLIKTRSDSLVNITGSAIKFNVATVVELNYPSYIQILINTKEKQFAIRGCKKDDPNAIHFAKPDQKYAIKFNQPVVVNMIRQMAGWSAEESWSIPGVYFSDDKAIVYDVSAAQKPVAKGGGWAAKRQKEAEAAKKAQEEADS